jgi:hypothetical protein
MTKPDDAGCTSLTWAAHFSPIHSQFFFAFPKEFSTNVYALFGMAFGTSPKHNIVERDKSKTEGSHGAPHV